MNIETVRAYCLTLPHVTEDMQWECILFRIARKIFALAALEPDNGVVLSFKCTPDRFAELVERPGIVPAPYMARAQWVALEDWDAARDIELREWLAEAHAAVFAKLPKKVQAELNLHHGGTQIRGKAGKKKVAAK